MRLIVSTAPPPLRAFASTRLFEVLVVGAAGLLVIAATHDIASRIPPLGDDWELLSHEPGGLWRDYVRRYGFARPVGLMFLDLLASGIKHSGADLFVVLGGIRVVALLCVYAIGRACFGLRPAYAALSAILAATFPSAVEGWTMFNTMLLLVASVAAFSCVGLYSAAIRSALAHSANHASAYLLAAAAAAQLLTLSLYEQALLAIPLFVAVVASCVWCHATVSRVPLLWAVGIAATLSLIWGLILVGGGYAASRSPSSTVHAVGAWGEVVSDATTAMSRLWIGTVVHHVWRMTGLLRGASSQILGDNPARTLAILLGFAAFVYVMLRRFARSENTAQIESTREAAHRFSLAGCIAIALAAAAYAAVLAVGLASPGFPFVSRMFFFPGLLLSVGVAVLLQRFRLARSKAVTLACVGLIGWSALISRHYLLEMNIGNSIVRITAETVAALPDSIRTRSILLLAPGVIGTFNTPAVQPSGTRQLIAHYNRGRVGPLFFGESCADIVVASPTVIDEGWLPVPLPAVAAVVRWTEGRAVAFATVRDACGRRS